MSQLSTDCLDVIFEYLEKDKITLRSCLLVNRLWCKVSVIILWRDSKYYCTKSYNTLISCLPNESKEKLRDNEIIISTPTSNPPIFNYASFCKVLSIDQVYNKIGMLLNQRTILDTNKKTYILVQEIFKLFMIQISSLKELHVHWYLLNVNFTSYPGAKDCLKNLSELYCNSKVDSEFFYQLSKISHNIKKFIIDFEDIVSNGLTVLISVQQNLTHLKITSYCDDYTQVISLLNQLPNTLIKFNLDSELIIPLSFISRLTNLQELRLSFPYNNGILNDFENLQYVNFPQLEILKIKNICPKYELLSNFLEINGKNLKEFYIGDIRCDNLLHLAIAKFCINLRKLSTGFKKNELETLNMVFNNCKHLESIKIWCGGEFLNEKEALESVVKYSHICELILYHLHDLQSELLPDELNSFLISWTNRLPQKSLSLIIVKYDSNSLDTNVENMKIIEKYIKLGVIKKFIVTDFSNGDYRN
ncbi:hypothetical protein C1645_828102 [Glomus cerebriforme]|uniref:F-box domain-containing protein n=1 Tax=Glomus cerebriforme TaxID=658196 RepID=A0A397SWF3_9GLOM|nr:hypothetical protein C1645_828102 [Glomus cerebriforme]